MASDAYTIPADARAANRSSAAIRLLDRLPIGVARFAGDGALLEANDAFLEIVEADSIASARRTDPARSLNLTSERISTLATCGHARWTVELTRPSGDDASIEVSAAAAAGEDHTLVVDVTIQDVRRGRETTARLQRTGRLEAVGQLAAGVAHDFNNILAIIGSTASLAESELGRLHPALAYLEEIQQAVQQAADLSRQILTLARDAPGSPTRFDACDAVRATCQLLRRLLGVDYELVVTTDPRPTFVHMERSHLVQIMINLVVNAREAMPESGRIEVCVHREPVGADGRCTIAVRDEGPGIEPDDLARLFEPWFTTHGSQGGSGLGLTIARECARSAGGQIRVDSVQGQGTTFLVELPQASPPA